MSCCLRFNLTFFRNNYYCREERRDEMVFLGSRQSDLQFWARFVIILKQRISYQPVFRQLSQKNLPPFQFSQTNVSIKKELETERSWCLICFCSPRVFLGILQMAADRNAEGTEHIRNMVGMMFCHASPIHWPDVFTSKFWTVLMSLSTSKKNLKTDNPKS